jgi:pre-rRNA-processing protein TSR4
MVDDEEFSSNDDEDSSSEKSLETAMASTSTSDNESAWKAAPSYPTLYLSTVAEYISAPPKFKLPPGTQIIDPLEEDGKAGGKDASWISERQFPRCRPSV